MQKSGNGAISKDMTPRVSIVTPLHNKGAYVAETIESVLAQSMPDLEMIVVQNYSTDDGPTIARGFAETDVRVRYVEAPPEVRGPGAARNCGLHYARGEWILFLDADDMIAPKYLAERLVSAAKLPNAPLVVGGWSEMHQGQPGAGALRQPAGFRGEPDAVRDIAIGFAPWILHAALVKKSWLSAKRSWPEELDRMPSEDAAFWFRVVLDAEAIAWCEGRGAVHRLGLAESREGRTGSLKRAEALRGVIKHNLRCLEQEGLRPSDGQCETLARVFEQSAKSLTAAGAQAEAAVALAETQRWLQKTKSIAIGIRLRKILGPALFQRLRGWRSGMRQLLGRAGKPGR